MVGGTGKLTALAIKAAKPGKLFDGGGLFLDVRPNGSRYWRMKYRYGGKENLRALGVYPEISLAEARQLRDAARSLIRMGVDPNAHKRAAKELQRRDVDGLFSAVAEAWLEARKGDWAPETYRKAKYVVDSYLTPKLGKESIATLTSAQAIDAVEEIAETAPSLANKARNFLTGIVTYAIRKRLREEGKLLSMKGVAPNRARGHIPAATDPKTIAELARAIDAYITPVTRGALKLAMLTAMRPGIVASARWDEIDLEAAEWHVAGDRMKMRHAHIVSLPTQAVDVLRSMQAYTEGQEYVFPPLARQGTPHLHRDALSRALRLMGFEGRHATHGFRGMLRTVARERLRIDPDILEAQLAHAKKGDVQKAYDRTTFNDERRTAMQAWADYIDQLKSNDNSGAVNAKLKQV
ncbi:tyrosine-type recombinase/integrase [Thermomonas sp.]|uniref:tyrosine-type recombinase/integrase n=1 Tax=Thermomonas sp. TaxID=1971895 RepID=UPI0035AE566E